MTLNVMFLKGR